MIPRSKQPQNNPYMKGQHKYINRASSTLLVGNTHSALYLRELLASRRDTNLIKINHRQICNRIGYQLEPHAS